MNLVGQMPVGIGEASRYLLPAVESLLGFCDEVVCRCEGPAELDLLSAIDRVVAFPAADWRQAGHGTFSHEGRARQELLDATVARKPTHVLAVDADEFVGDGPGLRVSLSDGLRWAAWTVCMEEVWTAGEDVLRLRVDGGWQPRDALIAWAVPRSPNRPLAILDKPLATGRVPTAAGQMIRGCVPTNILHFGWANEADRERRYSRYAQADGGRFHRGSHIESIMWPDEQVTLTDVQWPAGISPALRQAILERTAG